MDAGHRALGPPHREGGAARRARGRGAGELASETPEAAALDPQLLEHLQREVDAARASPGARR